MRNLSFAVLACLVFLFACEKQPAEMLTSENLVGDWKTTMPEVSDLMFRNIYGNALQLQKNNAFEFYYWDRQDPRLAPSGKSWRLENGNELVLELGLEEERCIITEFNGTTMTINHPETGEQYVLTKAWRRNW